MAFKEVSGGSKKFNGYWPKKAAERKAGDSITGVYEGKVEYKDPSGLPVVLYKLNTSDGSIGVNSSAVIARSMEQVPEGSTVKIIFNGKQRNPKTNREYNDFTVMIDDGSDSNQSDDELDFNDMGF